MKKLYLIFSLLFGILNLNGQGIDFFEGHYSEAFNKASSSDMLFFVDAYAEWCGPCKRMAKQVFPLDEVGSFFNDNFISMQIDMEKGQGLEFGKKYPVRAYPTFFFLDGEGNVVYQFTGGRDPQGFIGEAKKALSKFDNTAKYEKLYEEGDRSAITVYKYIKALNRAGKSSLKVANEYIATQKNLKTQDNIMILFEACTEADSKIFELLIDHKSFALKHIEEKEFSDKIVSAAKQTFLKSIEFNSPDLEKEAIGVVKKYAKSELKTFEIECDLEKAERNSDAKNYVNAATKYYKYVINGNVKQEMDLVQKLLKMFEKDEDALTLASEISISVANKSNTTLNCILVSNIYSKRGQFDNAKIWAEKALLAAGENAQDKLMAERVLKYLESL